jgi:hypothetical protein
MKRVLSLVVLASLGLTLIACGGPHAEEPPPPDNTANQFESGPASGADTTGGGRQAPDTTQSDQ